MTTGAFVRGAYQLGKQWLARRPRAQLAIGCGLFVLSVASVTLPPHAIPLAVLFGLPSVVLLATAAFRLSFRPWLSVVVLFSALLSTTSTGVWLGEAIVQTAGHDESCLYVSATDHQDNRGNRRTDWVVRCPDGQLAFTAEYPEIADANAPIPLRSAGPLFTPLLADRVHDYGTWFVAVPALALLIGSLITALRSRRKPAEPL